MSKHHLEDRANIHAASTMQRNEAKESLPKIAVPRSTSVLYIMATNEDNILCYIINRVNKIKAVHKNI